MRNLYAVVVVGGCLVITGCHEGARPTTPISPTAVPLSPPGGRPGTIAFGEPVEMALDGTVSSGGWYCELGDDPVPCKQFVLDVPRAATVVVRVEFVGNEPMFIQVGNLALGPHLSLVTGGSPLVARAAVSAGILPFRVGLYAPWGRNGYVAAFRVVATLE